MAKIWGEVNFMQQTIQLNFLLFDSSANTACYVLQIELDICPIFIVLRDIEERGRDLENVLFQYTNLVKPAFEEFCMPVSIPLILTWHLNMFILRIFKYAFQLNNFLIIICRLRNTLTLLYLEELITRVTIFTLL
jgi:hypothetical protein